VGRQSEFCWLWLRLGNSVWSEFCGVRLKYHSLLWHTALPNRRLVFADSVDVPAPSGHLWRCRGSDNRWCDCGNKLEFHHFRWGRRLVCASKRGTQWLLVSYGHRPQLWSVGCLWHFVAGRSCMLHLFLVDLNIRCLSKQCSSSIRLVIECVYSGLHRWHKLGSILF